MNGGISFKNINGLLDNGFFLVVVGEAFWVLAGCLGSISVFGRYRLEVSPRLPLTGTEDHVDDGAKEIQRRRRIEHVGPFALGALVTR